MYIEGKPDRVLAHCLGIKKRFTQNARYKKGVLKRVAIESNVLGIVDQDPLTIQNYRRDMLEFQKLDSKYSVELNYHQSTKSKLIVLCPELESWILKAAKASKVDVKKFNLPNKASALHSTINNRLPNFERLVNELIIQQNPSILYLKSLLTP